MILARLFEALRGGGARQRLRKRRVQELLGRADALLSSEDLAGAERCYSDVLDLDGTLAEAHAQLALLLTGSRRFTEALSHYRAAYARETLRGDVLESYVRVLLHSGLLDEALEVSDSAVRSDPATYETWLSAGLAALALHRYDQALAAFERAITLRSDSMEAHTNRGIALQNLGRLDEAESELARVLDNHPDEPSRNFISVCVCCGEVLTRPRGLTTKRGSRIPRPQHGRRHSRAGTEMRRRHARSSFTANRGSATKSCSLHACRMSCEQARDVWSSAIQSFSSCSRGPLLMQRYTQATRRSTFRTK